MKDIFTIDFRDAVRKIVKKELKEKFNIKAIKDKEKVVSDATGSNVFGVSLSKVFSKNINNDKFFSVPVFLIDAFEYLSEHLKVEGLFRKSGSVGRQKMLREIVEKDGTCCSCDFVQAHDVASLVKQFFRELPDPLITHRLTPIFLKCTSLTSQSDAVSALALCCILLPDEHLRVLKYFTKFINDVANHSVESKMTLSNLSIVFAPNLMSTQGKDKNSEKSMKEITHVVTLLFKNAHLIGMIPDVLYEKASTLNNEGGCYSSSGDELEEEINSRLGRTLVRSEKKRDRSKSITNFLKRNFRAGENKASPKHARAKSEKASPLSRKLSLRKEASADDLLESSSLTRRRNSDTDSPARKSPRLLENKEQLRPVVISKPTLKNMPNQVATTPRRHLTPIHQNTRVHHTSKIAPEARREKVTPALPSKFQLNSSNPRKSENVSKVNLCRSQTTYVARPSTSSLLNGSLDDSNISQVLYREDGGDITPQQTKISRNTQKPHVRKSRRASSMNRRRARYASQRRERKLPKTPDQIEGKYTPMTSETGKTKDETIGANAAFIETDNSLTPDSASKKEIPSTSVNEKSSINSRNSSRKQSSSFRTIPITNKQISMKNPTTPRIAQIQRSSTNVESLRNKPPTPYSITPRVGMRKKRPVIGDV